MARRGDDFAAVAASAAQIRLSDESPLDLSRRAKRVGHVAAWQEVVWDYYETVGAVWYAHNYVGNTLSRLHWRLGARDPDGDVVPLFNDDGVVVPELGVPDDLAKAAQDHLDRLVGVNGTHGEWARPLGVALACVGDGYLVGYAVDDDDEPVAREDDGIPNAAAVGEVWDAFAVTEVGRTVDERQRPRVKVRRSEDADAVLLPPDTVLVRIWRRHPRFPDDADSPMRALIEDVLEPLRILSAAVRGSALSKTHANLLLVPAEDLGIPLTAHGRTLAQNDGGGPPPNPVVTEIIAGLSAPHRDPGSAAALVPTIITTKGEGIEKGRWKLLDLSRDIDPEQRAEREELRRIFAQGVDLPPEILTGTADINHWGMWHVSEDSWRHIEPTAALAGAGVAAGYLWPALRADGHDRATVRRLTIYGDPVGILVHPNRTADATDGLRLGAISVAAYRRYKQFPESDAPTDAELGQRFNLGLFSGSASPRPLPASAETVEEGTPATDPPGVVAAAGGLDVLTRSAATIETRFLREALLLADSAVADVVDKVALQLRGAARRDPALRAALGGVEIHRIGAIVGQAKARRYAKGMGTFQEDDDPVEELFALELAALGPRFRALVDGAVGDWADVLAAAGFPVDDLEAERMAGDAATAETVFLGSLAILAAMRLFTPLALATEVEGLPGVTVPAAPARRASAAAGGVPTAPGVEPLARWEGGLATGQTTSDILGARGLVRTGLVWSHGGGGRTVFPEHAALDGVEGTGFDDPVFGGCPWGECFPGDHNGCSCSWAWKYTFA